MNTIPITLLAALLLTLNGCGEHTSGNKTEPTALAVPVAMVKELSPEEKFAETKRKAEAGDAKAQFSLGLAYHFGNGVAKDSVRAVEWYQKAATQGNASAQTNLGELYASGEGVQQDFVKAAEWYQKSTPILLYSQNTFFRI